MTERSQVRIESGGTSLNSKVYINGELVDTVQSATWHCDDSGIATTELTFTFVEVDIVGETELPEPLRILATEREGVERFLRFTRAGWSDEEALALERRNASPKPS